MPWETEPLGLYRYVEFSVKFDKAFYFKGIFLKSWPSMDLLVKLII